MGTKDGGKKPNPNDLNSFKGFFYYMIMILVITVLLNGLVFPSALKSQVKEVGYNEFLAMVDNNQVTQVEKDDTNGEYMFIAKDSNGKEQVYKTGLWDDPDLTDRLYSKGVTFDKVIPRKESAIMNIFVNWILPFMIMIAIGQLLSRSMAKRMGGNAMTFGKSNAKIYAESETGVTFADVAGEEEAKDALKEIVDFLTPQSILKNFVHFHTVISIKRFRDAKVVLFYEVYITTNRYIECRMTYFLLSLRY